MSIITKLESLSLRWQICAVLVAALAASLFITGTLAYLQSRETIIEVTLDKVMAETNAAASQLDHVLQSTRLDTASTPTFPPIQGLIRCWDNDGKTDPQGNSTADEWAARLTELFVSQIGSPSERLRYGRL